MSLDVSLIQKDAIVMKASSGIFIRENGETKEISHQQWNERYPDREPVKIQPQETQSNEVYSANITHNLGTMAEKAGIYKHLWRPEELGITTAKELIEPLKIGLDNLKKAPIHFKQFNASNGWGLYEHFVPFVEKYLMACEEYPEAKVVVSR